MKTRATLAIAAFLLCFNVNFAQQDEECMNNLTIFTDYYKSDRLNEAYEPWKKVYNKCPKFNRAIYAYGEKILKHKIENSTGTEQVGHLNELMKLWDDAVVNFAANYSKGEILSDQAELMYDYRKELNATDKQIYDILDKTYKTDLENFTSPKALYIYFSTIVELHGAGQVPVQDVFNKYDDVKDKIETEIDNYTKQLNVLVEKEEKGTLEGKEPQYKKQYENFLENYDKISGSIDTKLGQLANCENLIPLYQKDFEAFKNDPVWLKRAVNRMYNKECTEDPLYIDLVKAYDAAAPSSDTKYFVYGLLMKQGKEKEAQVYLNQSYDLEKDPLKKAKLAMRFGKAMKSRGNYGSARNYFQESLKLNPSNGKAYIEIANMYAASANNCGDTTFNKRAVYWLAASEARKAGRVDANLASYAEELAKSFEGRAPSRGEIFTAGNGGETIRIGCWINSSVTVPAIK